MRNRKYRACALLLLPVVVADLPATVKATVKRGTAPVEAVESAATRYHEQHPS